jgi:hypothetical protein
VTASRPVDISELRKKTRLLVTEVGGERVLTRWQQGKNVYLVEHRNKSDLTGATQWHWVGYGCHIEDVSREEIYADIWTRVGVRSEVWPCQNSFSCVLPREEVVISRFARCSGRAAGCRVIRREARIVGLSGWPCNLRPRASTIRQLLC